MKQKTMFSVAVLAILIAAGSLFVMNRSEAKKNAAESQLQALVAKLMKDHNNVLGAILVDKDGKTVAVDKNGKVAPLCKIEGTPTTAQNKDMRTCAKLKNTNIVSMKSISIVGHTSSPPCYLLGPDVFGGEAYYQEFPIGCTPE